MINVLKEYRGYIKQVQSRILFLKMLLEYKGIEFKDCYIEDSFIIIRVLSNSNNKGIGVSIKHDDFMNTHIELLCRFIINLLEKES